MNEIDYTYLLFSNTEKYNNIRNLSYVFKVNDIKNARKTCNRQHVFKTS